MEELMEQNRRQVGVGTEETTLRSLVRRSVGLGFGQKRSWNLLDFSSRREEGGLAIGRKTKGATKLIRRGHLISNRRS